MYLKLESLMGCQLAIGQYPIFSYDASGGGGSAAAIFSPTDNPKIYQVNFDIKEFNIPNLDWKTVKILGLPLLPGLEIVVLPKSLEGFVDFESGNVSLYFDAAFIFSIISIIKAPALVIKTLISTKEVTFLNSLFRGEKMNKDGFTTLVGTSVIPKCGNFLLDEFLGLPNQALAVLKCRIS